MGARFDKWLARPDTLRALRQLVGSRPAIVRTKQPHWKTCPELHASYYTTAQPALVTCAPDDVPDTLKSFAATAPSIDTFHERRERVARELGLRIPREDQTERCPGRVGPQPSSTSYSDLLYSEARVRDFSVVRDLLIDEPVNHANFEAWCKILEYRQRTDGFAGVLDVWTGMRKRGIDLPVEGNRADFLWTTFIHAAAGQVFDEAQKRLLRELVTHAQELKASGSGQFRPLYTILMGRFLRVLPGINNDREWRSRKRDLWVELHEDLCESGFYGPRSLDSLVMDVLKSAKPQTALHCWQSFYRRDPFYHNDDGSKRGLYDLCMPLVLLHSTDDPTFVIKWHIDFIKKNDNPGPELSTKPSVSFLMDIDKKLDASQLQKLSAILKEERDDIQQSTIPSFSRAAMNGLVGDVHGIKPKAIGDKFCARMFATQAFSLETIIRGLALLGTESLGPIALRELATRAATLENLKERLADVKNAGIAILPSRYAHILDAIVANSQNTLFQALLASDQHPESYDDQDTQKTLLDTFLEAEDLPQAHLTLLGLCQETPDKIGRAWNQLLQHYTKLKDHKQVVRIYDHICSEQLIITSQSLQYMMRHLLAFRKRSKRPQIAPSVPLNRFVSINFVVNAHMYAALHGEVLTTERWVELLKRIGMTSNVKSLERLVPWLAQRYHECSKGDAYNFAESTNGNLTIDNSRRSTIFTPPMLRAIIIWGFRAAGIRVKLQSSRTETWTHHNTTPTMQWTRGITLVLQLKQMGVSVKTKDVRRAVTGILWTLFGPAVSKRQINIHLIRLNELTLADYMRDANAAWDKPLYDIPSDAEVSEQQLLGTVFGRQRLADQKTGIWVDVEGWAAAKDEGSWQEAPPNLPDRYAAWAQNPFKFKDNFPTRRQRQFASREKEPLKVFRKADPSTTNVTQKTLPVAQPSTWRPLPVQPDSSDGT